MKKKVVNSFADTGFNFSTSCDARSAAKTTVDAFAKKIALPSNVFHSLVYNVEDAETFDELIETGYELNWHRLGETADEQYEILKEFYKSYHIPERELIIAFSGSPELFANDLNLSYEKMKGAYEGKVMFPVWLRMYLLDAMNMCPCTIDFFDQRDEHGITIEITDPIWAEELDREVEHRFVENNQFDEETCRKLRRFLKIPHDEFSVTIVPAVDFWNAWITGKTSGSISDEDVKKLLKVREMTMDEIHKASTLLGCYFLDTLQISSREMDRWIVPDKYKVWVAMHTGLIPVYPDTMQNVGK